MSDKAKNNIENEMLKQFFMHGLIGCSDKLSNEKLNYILYQQRLIQERQISNEQMAIKMQELMQQQDFYNKTIRNQNEALRLRRKNNNIMQYQNRSNQINVYVKI